MSGVLLYGLINTQLSTHINSYYILHFMKVFYGNPHIYLPFWLLTTLRSTLGLQRIISPVIVYGHTTMKTSGSCPIPDVKQRRARLVLGWLTAWEYQVL